MEEEKVREEEEKGRRGEKRREEKEREGKGRGREGKRSPIGIVLPNPTRTFWKGEDSFFSYLTPCGSCRGPFTTKNKNFK